jgi:hypothetical protein
VAGFNRRVMDEPALFDRETHLFAGRVTPEE